MNDEQLSRLLRDAAPPPVDGGLTPSQRARMERIMTEPLRRRRALVVGVPAVAFAAMLAVVLVVVQPFTMSTARAYGPAPLSYVSIDETLAEVVSTAARRLSRPGEAQRFAHATAWNLAVDENGSGERVSVIQPSVSQLTWREDLSGELLVTAGEPYAPQGESSDTVEPGTVLDDRSFGVGEYSPLVPDGGEFGADEFSGLLADYAGDTRLAGDAMLGIEALLTEWTLTDAQHALLLESLLSFEDLRLLGATTDRLGREVVGVSGAARRGHEATLFVSVATGRIVGLERTVQDPDNLLGVPAGTVISYTLWKDTQ